MKKLFIAGRLFLVLFLAVTSLPLQSANALDTLPKGLIISEIKVKNGTQPDPEDASRTISLQDEFIEIYNGSEDDVTLDDYYLEYYNVYDPLSQTASTHKEPFALPSVDLPKGGIVVLAIHPENVNDSLGLENITSFLDSQGLVRLLKPLPIMPVEYELIDQVAWSAETTSPSGVFTLPSSGSHSLNRVTHDETAVFDDTWMDDIASPGDILLIPAAEDTPDEEPTNEPDETGEPTDEESEPPEIIESFTPPALELSELLPNPAPPQTDADDEFTEIYNPNDEAVDLQGYTVQTGSTYGYSYVIPGGSIAPHSYYVLTSGNTNLSLANTGGQARLLSPEGDILSEATAYGKAEDGQAWALVNGAWQWTTSPTPGTANILTAPEAKSSTKKASSSKTAKAKTTPKNASAVKSSTTKKQTAVPVEDGYSDEELPPPVHPVMLAGGGVSALVYAGYEYKADAINKLHQLRRYRAVRRATRQKP